MFRATLETRSTSQGPSYPLENTGHSLSVQFNFSKKEACSYLDIYIADARLYFRLNLIKLLAGAWKDDQKTTGSMHIKPSKHDKSNVVFVYTFDNNYVVQF